MASIRATTNGSLSVDGKKPESRIGIGSQGFVARTKSQIPASRDHSASVI